MPTPVIMPKFGMAQEEGTVLRWLKAAGDAVTKGEPLLEVQTDKVDMEVEAPVAGILGDIQSGPGTTVPVATVIAMLFAPGETPSAAQVMSHASRVTSHESSITNHPSPVTPRPTPLAQRVAADQGVDLGQVAGTGPAGRITKADVEQVLARQPAAGAGAITARPRATPAARRLARTGGIELAGVAGSGPAGRIQAADVAIYLEQLQAEPVRADMGSLPDLAGAAPQAAMASAPAGNPLRGMRKTIAARLSQAWQTIPHIFLSTAIDMTQAESLRTRLEADVAKAGGRLTPTVIILRAVATALTHHPRLNAWLRAADEQWVLAEQPQIDLGVAVALAEGLIVPVVRGVDRLGFSALAVQITTLSQRARAGELTAPDVVDGTFTVSNLGMYPIDHFTAIINPPQVAILAVGRAQQQPVWDGAGFVPRLMLEVTLSADHRAVDGAVGAAFLAELKQLIEEPARLLL